MHGAKTFLGALLLPDRVSPGGRLRVQDGRIVEVGQIDAPRTRPVVSGETIIDAGDGFISPGFVDLHVHGGAGADFMDGTPQAFSTALAAHARHGTTSIVPTSTVARHDQVLAFLEQCSRHRVADVENGARVLGAHFYGPYFAPEARGCHPGETLRPPDPEEYAEYLAFSDSMLLATVAPELPGAAGFAKACRELGVRINLGHSQATFGQVAAAIGWGARHVDHLYCAMSDKSKLRRLQAFPMRGGLLEATLYFDELTTEVIADGKHLSPDLLLLALKIKGPDRLALVTDCSRALDMPEGEYLFGPLDGGEPFVHQGGVGLLPGGEALASSTQGMDHMVRTFCQATGRPLWEVIRMASLTPARICGHEQTIGSLEIGKRADILVLGPDLHVRRVFIAGRELTGELTR